MSSFAKASILAISLCIAAAAHGEPRRRALLIGIDDYSGGKKSPAASSARRGLPNLDGAVNDVVLIREILLSVYHFAPGEIVTLRNRDATRTAILAAIDAHLGRKTGKDDVLLFYFSGHGSQVANSLSEEEDRLDESIVPADSRSGAADIRDKELRRLFLPLLERGARLTVMLDSCHSGSGVRGLPGGGKARFVAAVERDAKDGYRGPTLEERGALVLSAARDSDTAFELRGDDEKLQGAFSWAWARAVRDAAPDEPAAETFQRAAARMSIERPDQVPVIAGPAEARFAPFLGMRKDRRSDRVVVAVASVENGVVTIKGGWANGLTRGSELRPVTEPPSETRLEVIALDGVQGSTARITKGSAESLGSGSLLELVSWAAPLEKPLRVWMPEGDPRAFDAARALAKRTRELAFVWTDDPTDTTPDRIIRWNAGGWESVDRDRRVAALKQLDALPSSRERGASTFVQLPASSDVATRLALHDGIERVHDPREADYILAGRLACDDFEYAWIRPSVDERDIRQGTLPLRTKWHRADNATELASLLAADLRRLQRIHFWQTLPSPPETPFHYRLGIRRTRDRALVTDGTLRANERYGLVLLANAGEREHPAPRFVYVFMVDSHGKSVLLYPRSQIGSLENRHPASAGMPEEIRLGPDAAMIPEAPFGTDTYFLLTTEEPLMTPWMLEWDGVRSSQRRGRTPFERLLSRMMSGERGVVVTASTRWSIERLPFMSMPAPPANENAR